MSFVIPTNTTWPVTIPGATKSSDGVMTKEQVKQLDDAASDVITENILIYLSITGNDSNPGTQALPIQTINEALKRFPVGWTAANRWMFGPGVFDLPDAVNRLNLGGSYKGNNNAEPFVMIGEATNEVGNRVSDSVVGSTQIGDSTIPGTAVDQYIGACITILTGANAGQARTVRSNTATGFGVVFTVNSPFTNPLVVGDQFQISRPATIIRYAGFFLGLRSDTLFGAKNIKFQTFNPSAGLFLFNSALESMENVEFELNGSFMASIDAAFLNGGSFPGPWRNFNANGVDNPFSDDRFACGAYIHDGAFASFQSDMEGYYVFNNLFVNISGTGTGFLQSLAMKDSNVLVDDVSACDVLADDPTFPGLANGSLFGLPSGTFQFHDRSSAFNFGGIEISNSLGHAIRVARGAYLTVSDVPGAGNAGAGIQVDGMSQASFDPALTTVTGAAGDTIIGTTPQTYAALTPAGFTSNLDRIEPTV